MAEGLDIQVKVAEARGIERMCEVCGKKPDNTKKADGLAIIDIANRGPKGNSLYIFLENTGYDDRVRIVCASHVIKYAHTYLARNKGLLTNEEAGIRAWESMIQDHQRQHQPVKEEIVAQPDIQHQLQALTERINRFEAEMGKWMSRQNISALEKRQREYEEHLSECMATKDDIDSIKALINNMINRQNEVWVQGGRQFTEIMKRLPTP